MPKNFKSKEAEYLEGKKIMTIRKYIGHILIFLGIVVLGFFLYNTTFSPEEGLYKPNYTYSFDTMNGEIQCKHNWQIEEIDTTISGKSGFTIYIFSKTNDVATQRITFLPPDRSSLLDSNAISHLNFQDAKEL